MTFYVTERGRYFPDDSEDKGRLLSAGYHNTMGYFRDDTPLIGVDPRRKGPEGTQPAVERVRLTSPVTPTRTWVQYFFNQSGEVQGKGAESGSARPTDHEITDTAVITQMREAYLAKAEADPKNDPVALGGHLGSLQSREQHAAQFGKGARPMPSRSIWRRCCNSPRALTAVR